MLKLVTITGADDSVEPAALAALSKKYPWVEWGILASASQTGRSMRKNPRFPSFDWIEGFLGDWPDYYIKRSLHVCGRWVRDLLRGVNSMPDWLPDDFQRIQLNFHAERTECDPPAFWLRLRDLVTDPPYGSNGKVRQFIFQIDGELGNRHLDALLAENGNKNQFVDAVPLFDVSGGAGILPDAWPKPYLKKDDLHFAFHGYAGGLGSDNLAEQLPRILEAAGDTPCWIDMETRVRSDDDTQFDLDKVNRCLEIAAPFVGKE